MNETELKKFIGKRLGQLRTARGLSQSRLAAAAGLHETYISMVENARRSITVVALAKLCAALEVTLEEFFQEMGV